QLNDRDDLWRLLATITVRKALDTMRHQTRQKRGGGRVLGESALLAGDDADGEGVAEILSRAPPPEEIARLAEEYTRFLDRLKDPTLRSVALRRLEGQSTQEIARALNVSTKTIDRKLHLMRAIWTQDNPR